MPEKNYDYAAAQFMNLLIKNAPLSQVASLIELLLDHPVKISDITRNPLAFSPSYPKDDDDDHLNLYRHISPGDNPSHQAHLYSMLITGRATLWAYPYMRRKRYLCGAIYDGHWMGHVTLPDVGRFDHVDLDLIAFCAKMLGLILWTKGAPHLDHATNGHFLLWSLLNGYTDLPSLEQGVIFPVFDNLPTYRILYFQPGTREDTLLELLSSTLNKWWHLPYANGFAVLTDGADTAGLTQLETSMQSLPLLAGVSDAYVRAEQTKMQFELARNTLKYAQKVGMHHGLFRYDNFKLFELINAAAQNLDLRLFEHSIITQIERHDEENATEYGLTLRAYLNHRQNAAETAETMHIHKNTVFYRINKIRELFHIDFQDPLQIATLYSSIIIHDRML